MDRYGRHATGGICSVGQVMEHWAIWDSFGCNRTNGVGLRYWTGMDVVQQEEFSMLGLSVREQDQMTVSDRRGLAGTGSMGNIGQVTTSFLQPLPYLATP